MPTTFRPYEPDQGLLWPPDLRDWLAKLPDQAHGIVTSRKACRLMKKKGVMICCFVAACVAGAALWAVIYRDDRTPQIPVGYVVCRDQNFQNARGYRVDFLNGETLSVSDHIDWMGNPAHLAIDPQRRRLYVSSHRGKARDYYPI